MNKKVVLVLLLATLIAGGAFAQFSMSAGLGGTFSADFMGYALTQDGKDALKAINRDTNYFNENHIGGSFFAYFDATYVMVSLGMGFYDLSYANKDYLTDTYGTNDIKQSFSTFDIGILGKYPIPLGAATLFPMLGVDFKIAVSFTAESGGIKVSTSEDIAEYYSSVWFKLGVGADIPLGEKLYLRPMFLYGFGTLPKANKELLDYYNDPTKMADGIYHGLDVTIAVGYKF